MGIPVILVVEDEALVRMLAADYFEEAGYEVIQASNGDEALRALKDRPDVRAVFTDVQMPGLPDGLALSRHVREICPDCAIVIASGRVRPGKAEMAIGARFLPKPYTGTAVVQMVGELMAA